MLVRTARGSVACPTVRALNVTVKATTHGDKETKILLEDSDMTLKRRTPLTRRGASTDGMDTQSASASAHRHLLRVNEVPPWYTQEFIHTGYRPVRNSVLFCFRSLLYIHNETANIYSHLLPAIAALILAVLLSRYFDSNFPAADATDRLVFQLYLATSVACFSVSSLYHTLLCHSRHYFDLWVRIDYVAILFQILGSFIPGIYLGFYCEPELKKVYWSMVHALHAVPKPARRD